MRPRVFWISISLLLAISAPESGFAEPFLPADDYVIRIDVHVDPVRASEDPDETIANVRGILDKLDDMLPSQDYPGDTLCPVRYEHDNIREMPTSPAQPTTSDASRGLNLFANPVWSGGKPVAGFHYLGRIVTKVFESWSSVGAGTHEFGHLVGLPHTDRCIGNDFMNGFASCEDPPVSRAFVHPYQCTAFLEYSEPPVRKMRCTLYDDALTQPSGLPDPASFQNAAKWSPCLDNPGDSLGYCDGEYSCMEVVSSCFDSATNMPRSAGTDCPEGDRCRVCGPEGTTCVPCDAAIEPPLPDPDAYEPGFFYLGAGFPEGTTALYRDAAYAAPPERLAMQIGRAVRGLASHPDLPFVFTVETGPSGDDHLIRLDPVAQTASDLGNLGAIGIDSIAFGSDTSELLAVSVDASSGSSVLYQLDPNVPVSATLLGTIGGATNVTRIAFDPTQGTERLWGLTDSGATLLEIDPATLQVIPPSLTLVLPAASLTFDRADDDLYGYIDDAANGAAQNLSGTGFGYGLPFVPGTDIATFSVCGNGSQDPGEECDDGNLFDHDLCSRYCTVNDENASDVVAAMADTDGDGIPFYQDDCPTVSDPLQEDVDSDDVGDACDNCLGQANWEQLDSDSDGVADACDNVPAIANADQADSDSDGVADVEDNCPAMNTYFSPTVSLWADQSDADSDGIGDACDNCPQVANPTQADSDSDLIADACDNCPAEANPFQVDLDGDGLGDACDSDDDHDGVADVVDNCVRVANAPPTGIPAYRTTTGGQIDDDADGYGNDCDGDFDNNGVLDPTDAFALLLGLGQNVAGVSCYNFDTGAGDGPCDIYDIDADGALDARDTALLQAMLAADPPVKCEACPFACEGDACDDDGDGVVNRLDNCTQVANGPNEGAMNQCDSDSDGYGNVCDGDLDGNGFVTPLDAPTFLTSLVQFFVPPASAEADMNCDGFVTPLDSARFTAKLVEFLPGPSGLSCAGSVPCPTN